ncbi:hexosaminidase D-like isoform X2 [Ambystoma mexicanum]|uniref:hexosaminidase D-like isoform X2 n=1 Tax=Ambystoma mexicanum TaxID=8296 RepID=UPI0037E91076
MFEMTHGTHRSSGAEMVVVKLQKEQPHLPEKDQDWFWGNSHGSDTVNDESKKALPPEPPHEERAGAMSDSSGGSKRAVAKDFSQKQMKLVHLDLKGAAPKVSYFEQVFPLFAKLGANGLLIEYEDMFPFQGELEILRSPYAYSEEDIEKILHLAQINGLEVVPLVQCFGHMEFVLKHDKYKHLREVEKYPNSLNPHAAETLPLVTSILRQVLDRHPQNKWFHIGADEVFYLGEGHDSKTWMNSNNGDMGKMYLNHIQAVISFLIASYKEIQVLMWDDMLRRIKMETIQESGIMDHAAPMIWLYEADMDTNQISQYITKYQNSGFKTVWFASAFKGASGVAQVLTPMDKHQKNHRGWLQMFQKMKDFPRIHLQGIALTGWQRYDHFSALCELLPMGIPSLAVCLQTLVHGVFSQQAQRNILEMLGFKEIDVSKNICIGNGAFPGSEIYRLVEQIQRELKPKVDSILKDNEIIHGWFSRYHRKHRFGNPYKMERFGSKVLKSHEELETLIQQLRQQLEAVYFPDTVEEWMEEFVNPYMDPLREFVKDYQEIIKLNAQPKASLKRL